MLAFIMKAIFGYIAHKGTKMIVWIHKKDRASYEQLVQPPVILQENENDIQVAMTPNAMQMWVAVGYWYGM